MEAFLVTVFVGILIGGFFSIIGLLFRGAKHVVTMPQRAAETREEIRIATEKLAVGLMLQYGTRGAEDDAAIAQLMRDDLTSAGYGQSEAMQFATAETVGRARRNMLRAAAERPVEPPPPLVRHASKSTEPQRCLECSTFSTASAERCSKCGFAFWKR